MISIVRKTRSLKYIWVSLLIICCIYYGCIPPDDSPENISDDQIKITLLDNRTKKPLKKIEVYVEGSDFREDRPPIHSDDNGIITIKDVSNRSFPIIIRILDNNYFEKSEVIRNRENVRKELLLERKQTMIKGGVMDEYDQAIEECNISTKPSVGVSTTTDEYGEFKLASDNFNENASYRIIVEHERYKSAEWLGIKPVKNSTFNLGWKHLIAKETYAPSLDSNKVKPSVGKDLGKRTRVLDD